MNLNNDCQLKTINRNAFNNCNIQEEVYNHSSGKIEENAFSNNSFTTAYFYKDPSGIDIVANVFDAGVNKVMVS